jgi:PIN domain nuclease of toxin-antitoxin system
VIKTQKGLLTISHLTTWWRQATELTAARVLHVRACHITALTALPQLHKDPFDRILIAEAKAERLGPVTRDGLIGEHPIHTIW